MADELTADDLRNRLYHSLREKGLVDSLKTQLRNKLVIELKQLGLSKSFHVEPKYAEEGSLLQKAANSLVIDHLRRCNYDYTLSVFMPESETADNKVFTTRDLLQLLNISPHSRLYKQISSSTKVAKKGFLWQLLCELAAPHGHAQHDTGVQTDPMKGHATSTLEEAFRRVDQYYASVTDDSKARGMAIEERLLSYQRQLDERARTEVQLEIARFKENEYARLKLQERENSRKEIEKMRKEMERNYQLKSDALAERERNSIERLQRQQEMGEKEMFTQRQSLLQEIEMVRQREAELRREAEIQSRENQLYDDKLKSAQELVKKREEIVKRAEIEYDQRINDQMNKFKLEEQGRYIQRYKELEVREARVRSDQHKLDEELQDIQATKDELRDKRIRVNEAEAELHKAKMDLISAQKKSEIMSEKLRQMVDYQVLKEENAVLKNEVEGLKMRLAELTKENMVERQKQEELLREMTHIAGHPAPEVVLLQRRLEKTQAELRQEQALADHARQQAEQRLQEEVGRNREMNRRFEEQTQQMKEMNQEMADLRQQLRQTRAALDNEVYRKPKDLAKRDSLCDESEYAGMPNTSTSLQKILLGHANSDSEAEFKQHRSSADMNSRSDDFSYSMELVHETKARLKNLEYEAEKLEANYRNFQHRITSVPPLTEYSSPGRHKVSFHDRPQLPSPMASPQLQKSKTMSRRSTNNTPAARPLSSTPYKHSNSAGSSGHDLHTPPRSSGMLLAAELEERPLMDISVSTVHSTASPLKEADLAARMSHATKGKGRLLCLDDLEAQPGDPSVVVVQGSEGSPETLSQITQSGQSTIKHTSSDAKPPHARALNLEDAWKQPTATASQPVTMATTSLDDTWKQPYASSVQAAATGSQPITTVTASLDDAWKQPVTGSLDDAWKQPVTASLDDAWKTTKAREEEQEAEDRDWEERRRQREEERRQKEQEEWEREQRALQRLQQEKNEKSPDASLSEPAEKDQGPQQEGGAEGGDSNIDPVMQKYMAMVKEQKEKEQALAKKSVDTWSKGQSQKDTTASHSGPDLSAADDVKSGASVSLSDNDFDW